jgi:hypothetical protein
MNLTAPFVYDAKRDQRWRTSMKAAVEVLRKNPAVDVRAIAYPTLPNDIALRWFECKGAGAGELHWQSFEPDAGSRCDVATWFDRAPAEASVARELFVFEDHPDSGDGNMVLGHADGRLFAHFTKHQALLPLKIDIESYINLQIAMLGLNGVIELLTDCRTHGYKKGAPSEHAATLAKSKAKRIKETRATAARVFPDLVEVHRNRLFGGPA